MNISQQVVILSAEQNGDSIENKDLSTRTLRNCLKDCKFNFNEGRGFYKGNSEASFIVIINNEDEIETLKDFAFKSFKQESILYQDANQEAVLLFANGGFETLGRLEQVTKDVALTKDGYTLMDGQYYTTLPRT